MRNKKLPEINLTNIADSSFLKSLKLKDLYQVSALLRKEIIDKVSLNGGHLSSNLGVIELSVALFYFFDLPKDKVIFDVSHQSYAYKLLSGRNLDHLRKKNGVSGFQDPKESAYDLYGGGHSSTSIGIASGVALSRDLNHDDYQVLAVIGDGSIANGVAFESLNNLATLKNKVIIFLNDNGMSISEPVGGFSKFLMKVSRSGFYRRTKAISRKIFYATRLGVPIYRFFSRIKNRMRHRFSQFNIFDNFGYKYLGPIDGNRYRDLERAIKKAKKSDKSVIIHLNTIKGKGLTQAENDVLGKLHGVNQYYISNDKVYEKHHNTTPSYSEVISNLAYQEMQRNQKAFLINPAMIVGTKQEKIFQDFPTRTLDVGIAEANALLIATGLALTGYHPIVTYYSTFLQRAFDPLIHDVARNNAGLLLLIDRIGFSGNDGPTHHGLYDLAVLLNLENVIICAPSSKEECTAIFSLYQPSKLIFAIRYPKAAAPLKPLLQTVTIGKWLPVQEVITNKIALITYGDIINELERSIKAADLFKVTNLYNALFQKPLDLLLLERIIKHHQTIIIYDIYATMNSFIAYLTKVIIDLGFKGQIIPLGVNDNMISHMDLEEQLKEHHLSPDNVVDVIKTLK
ncbi:MAG: 1-deoxy-D-xylulose-5-phosphate synthase [Erysipelotrichaceae bacterium]|jgi:1-deoxy-D-xylulose-5-phosphate synthase|nr:1-deoxy-D-xylulose-5-phosphate synthase [Erysipelotrichaceae bacterium]